MSTPDLPHTPGFAEMMAATTARGWILPDDPLANENPGGMTDYDRATDRVESERRDARTDALQYATWMHGEYEAQEAFRADETEKVIENAQRFYKYIWEGR